MTLLYEMIWVKINRHRYIKKALQRISDEIHKDEVCCNKLRLDDFFHDKAFCDM